MNVKALDAVFLAAFSTAIRTVGVSNLKRTSLFGSNDSRQEMKKAA